MPDHRASGVTQMHYSTKYYNLIILTQKSSHLDYTTFSLASSDNESGFVFLTIICGGHRRQSVLQHCSEYKLYICPCSLIL